MSYPSRDSVGVFNYRVKRDWRRLQDREIRAEGYDFFWPNTSLDLGDQPYPAAPSTNEPITLICEAIQPNGRRAIVAGTPTTLYRYFALDNGAYYTGDGTPQAYYTESGPDTPYYDDNPGVWLVIGQGFSPVAQRWEAVSLNGWLILNNGVDLPVTYRVQDFNVLPIYEMRESGIASVGNITVSNDLLLCADISEISNNIPTNLPISSGAITGTLASGVVTSSQAFFTPSWVGLLIQFQQGTTTTITGYTDSSHVTVADTTDAISTGQPFTLFEPNPPTALTTLLSNLSSGTTTAAQAGNYGPSPFDATMTGGIVTASIPFFNSGMIGKILMFLDATQGTIINYLSPTQVQVDNLSDVVNPGQPFWLDTPGTVDYTVVASAPFFTAAMVGQFIIWPSGDVRTITQFVDSEHVVVDSNAPVGSSVFSVNNPAAYAPYTDQTNISRIQYRILNGVPGEPRRWASSAPASIVSGSVNLAFQYPMVSLQELIGQQIIILGAGILGGNLAATLISLDEASMNAVIDTPAITTVVNSPVQAFDTVGSLVSYTDLQDDGSAILGMLDLLGTLVVYKDTAIFVGSYVGQAGNVFNFNGNTVYRGSKTLHYRYTLVRLSTGGTDFHIFAGRNSFYRFDLITQEPTEVKESELCKNLFFDNVGIPMTPGQELVPAGQMYGVVTIPTLPNTAYYYIPGASETSLQNGTQSITATAEFIAQGYSVTINGTSGQPVTASLRLTNNIGVYAADNPITKEVFFCFPMTSAGDKALRFDYLTQTISTTSAAYTACCAVKRPASGIQVGPTEDWFVMGLQDGTVVRYGLTDTQPFNGGPVTASQSGTTVTANAPIFTADLVIGRSIQWSDQSVVNVVAYVSPTQVTVGASVSRAADTFAIVPGIWHRTGQAYDSILESGLESFGTTFGEKALEAITVMLASQSPDTNLLLEVLGTINPNRKVTVLGSKLFTDLEITNTIGMLFYQNWYADRLTVSGVNNPCELIERLYNIAGIDSKAFIQR